MKKNVLFMLLIATFVGCQKDRLPSKEAIDDDYDIETTYPEKKSRSHFSC